MLALLVISPVLAWSAANSSPFTVDGRFEDWARHEVTRFHASRPSPDPDRNLTAYATHKTAESILFWAEVEGVLFSDPQGRDALYVFVDADGDASTGLALRGLGADYLIAVSGEDGAVGQRGLMRFDPWVDGDQEDWRGWREVARPDVAKSSNAIEIAVSRWDIEGLAPSFLVSFALYGGDGEGSWSLHAVGSSRAALRGELRRNGDVANVGDAFATLILRHEGEGDARVDAVTLQVEPRVPVAVEGLPVSVSGARASVELPIVLLAAPHAQPGDVLRVRVVAVSASSPLTIEDDDVAAYFFAPLVSKRIDGLFADWRHRTTVPSHDSSLNPNVDLTAQEVDSDGRESFFYAQVAGEALGGSLVPHPLASGDRAGHDFPDQAVSSAIPKSRRTGEDHITIWIDVDPGSGTGYVLLGRAADWKIEVLGRFGRPTGTAAYRWGSTGWTRTALDVAAAAEGQEVEIAAFKLNLTSSAEIFVEARDWRGLGEVLAFASESTRGENRPDTYPVLPRPLLPRPIPGDPQPYPCENESSGGNWPPDWAWQHIITDTDDPLPDPAVDILEVAWAYHRFWQYFHLRIVVEASSPLLCASTYQLYFFNDSSAKEPHDWLVWEKSGSKVVCSYQWDDANGDWGVDGTGCDIEETISDADEGGAVRVVPNCMGGTRGCIDFAIDKLKHPGLVMNPRVGAAASSSEDLDLLGSTSRYPCPDDCTSVVHVPEFGDMLFVAVPMSILVLLSLRRKKPVRPLGRRRLTVSRVRPLPGRRAKG